MSQQMADPHAGMVSFEKGLKKGILQLYPVRPHNDLYSHFDVPTPGTRRLTYVRLDIDRKTVLAFLSCLMNGEVDGMPCVAVGYAVPERFRGKGAAKQLLRDVIKDQALMAGRNGFPAVYIEAVVDVANKPSQRVAETVLGVERENITDVHSGRPAFRYTLRVETTSAP